MLITVVLLFVLPTLVTSSGEGNINLLEDEVATAIHACSYNQSSVPRQIDGSNRRSRSDIHDYQYKQQVPRIDSAKHDNMNLYGHEKRSSVKEINTSNGNDDIPSYGRTDTSVKYVRTAAMPSENAYNSSLSNWARPKRNGYLMNKSDQDQCLSQCVFANLQVVDERGIPREAELWNKVQTKLTSQQSRTVLRDQVRACFQELKSEDEENGCYYSNQLERCLMLRFADRKLNGTT